MSKVAAYWDSSAVVLLCVQETSSRQAHTQLRKSMPVVWWGSLVEVNSAIARLYRLGKLNDLGMKGALSRLDLLSRGWREILPCDPLRDLAIRLLDAYELRAADILQLAAAITWCQQRPARRVFVCADQRLAKAAKSEGFAVFEL